MRILPLIISLFSAVLIVMFFAGCNNSNNNIVGDCSSFTLDEQQCRLNFVFLEADHQSCCEAWLKNDFNE